MVVAGLVSSQEREQWVRFSSNNEREKRLIERTHTAYQRYLEDPSVRTEYFSCLSDLSRVFLNRQVEAFDSDDFYKQAEGILLGQVLRKYPISRQRLAEPAAQYRQAFADWNEARTLESLGALAEAHEAFAADYIPVFQHAARLKPGMIRWNFPRTVSLFQAAFMRELNADFELWAERVKSADEALIVRLPLLAVYEWVANQAREKPEIFPEDAPVLREAFQELEIEEREALYAKLAGDEVDLQTEEGKELYGAIVQFASDFQRGLAAETYNAIAQTLVRDWRKMVAIIESMDGSEPAKSDLAWTKAFLKALVEKVDFSEEMLPDAALYDLSTKRAVLALREDGSDGSFTLAAQKLLSILFFTPWKS